MKTEFRRWLAWGAGVGLEIGERHIEASIVRVRPGGVSLSSLATVENFRDRPAAEWGADLLAWMRKNSAAHLAATIILPRADIIVREVALPGVANKDLDAAVRYQIDSLHPFAEEEAVFSWARVPGTPVVLVGITRRAVIDDYDALFAEAGIKVASFTFSAAAVYSAIHLLAGQPSIERVGFRFAGEQTEIYGESEAHPVFSATLDLPPERAAAWARSEMRLPPEAEAYDLAELLPKPVNETVEVERWSASLLAYAAAVTGACRWLALDENLLPLERRRTSSRARLIPTAALGLVAAVLTAVLLLYNSYEQSKYRETLNAEIRRLESRAKLAEKADRTYAALRERVSLLDQVRSRTRADLDALNELTNVLAAPAWLNTFELTRKEVQMAGEAEQAAELLKKLDASPLFQGSEFTLPIARVGSAEAFRIKASREKSPQ